MRTPASSMHGLAYQAEGTHWWYVARRRIILSWLREALAHAGRQSAAGVRLLDYGCGTGLNLVHFAKLGTAYGLDAATEAVDYCRRRGLSQVMCVQSPDQVTPANVFGGQFDAITLLDVLEHIPDEVTSLRKVAALLKDGGLLVITVPAYRWLWSGEDYVSNHLRRYTASTLLRVLKEAGYDVLRISYFNSLLFPLQAAAVLWARAVQPRLLTETLVRPLPSPLNGALAAIMSLEAGFLRSASLPAGASLICTARIAT